VEASDYPEAVTTGEDWTLSVSMRVALAHAAVQVLAEDCGADVLHIKGPAVDDSLLDSRPAQDAEADGESTEVVRRSSIDADVLVRPGHVQRLLEAMQSSGGWTSVSRFEDSSPFEHDATLEHPFLGHTDVHRWFPGIGCEPETAFDRLWADRHTVHIAGYPCAVPAVTAQRLVLLLHAARGPVDGNADVRRTWDSATPAERAEVERLAVDLKATVALAAATGRLDQVKGDRSRELWQLLSSGDSRRVALWWAVVKSARTPWQATRASVRLAVPRRAVLRLRLGRPATRREVAGAYFTQARLGATELGAALRRDRLRP
jgi:hypothetical protein